ncbi:hypothetical protein SUDANB95_04875 [Actinosynnema sp. ALI-1.44]
MKSIRMALLLPLAALTTVLAPTAAPAQADQADDTARITFCPAGSVCAWPQPKGQPAQSRFQRSTAGCHATPWQARSVSNQTSKRVFFYENKNCTGRNFFLNAGKYSDYAGGSGMPNGVGSFRV